MFSGPLKQGDDELTHFSKARLWHASWQRSATQRCNYRTTTESHLTTHTGQDTQLPFGWKNKRQLCGEIKETTWWSSSITHCSSLAVFFTTLTKSLPTSFYPKYKHNHAAAFQLAKVNLIKTLQRVLFWFPLKRPRTWLRERRSLAFHTFLSLIFSSCSHFSLTFLPTSSLPLDPLFGEIDPLTYSVMVQSQKQIIFLTTQRGFPFVLQVVFECRGSCSFAKRLAFLHI